MAKSVFLRDDVADAWNRQVPIEVDTDTHPELAIWQQDTFTTQARPLYVRLTDGGETRWDLVFSADDDETSAELIGFLDGADSASQASGGSGILGFVRPGLARWSGDLGDALHLPDDPVHRHLLQQAGRLRP